MRMLGIRRAHALAYAPAMQRGRKGRCGGIWVPLVLACALLLHAREQARADEPPASEKTPAPQEAPEHATSEQAPPEALEHYQKGRDFFRAGRYSEAIVELKAALALDPSSPNLLYNVAYTSELLGNVREAITYYRKYLLVLPESQAAERKKALGTLRRLEGRLAVEPKPNASAAAAAGQPASRGFGRADFWFWSTLGSGAALLAGGAVTGVLALQRQSDVRRFVAGRDGSLAKRQGLINQAHTLALSSDILTGAGAALVVTAGLLFLLREPKAAPRRDTPTAALAIDQHGALLQLRAQF